MRLQARQLTRLLAAAAAFLAAGAARAQTPTPTATPTPLPTPTPTPPPGATSLTIPFTKYQLPNGLTVILHEDHSLPVVTVNVMVKTGSRFEEKGRTGFAHLFEHLMFMGTHRVPTKMYDAWMETEGGWNNAWTGEDRTDYFDVGPSNILPLLLWLEADRFLSLADDMDQAKLDTQRGVVRNERRQTAENEPYGKVELRLPELLYPEGHPYHHPVIGSHEDLQAATVADVTAFFRHYYVPNNSSLVVAGDFDPASARALIDSTFAKVGRGEVPAPAAVPPAKLNGVVREVIKDNVQLPKVIMAWHSPARYAPGDAELDLLGAVLQTGKASRLYKALVYDKKLAQEVSAYQSSLDLGSQFIVEVLARPGVSLDAVEAAVDAELTKVRDEGVTEAELTRAKNQMETAFVVRLESLYMRAVQLNQYETSHGTPDWTDKDLQRYRDATVASVREHTRATLDPAARVIIHVVPAPPERTGDAGKEAKP